MHTWFACLLPHFGSAATIGALLAFYLTCKYVFLFASFKMTKYCLVLEKTILKHLIRSALLPTCFASSKVACALGLGDCLA
jgi:hypothetical protein